ncbi:hypothetical protein [Acuticoccus sp.]|uniref:hypothetical protein n=1 Tax=Acuticoccus sp. TaxID=1904378 RepID=UPI003B52DC2C
MSQNDLDQLLRQARGSAPSGVTVFADLAFAGGVRTGPVTASERSELSVEAIVGTGELRLEGAAPQWRIVATTPLTGRWRITATEGADDVQKVLVLEENARERLS